MYKMIVIMGKSGSGKDTLMHTLLEMEHDFHEIISCTTRPIREGEVDGVNYHYYTIEQFTEAVTSGEMLEATTFNDWFYGTPYESLRSDCVNVGVFNPQGASSVLQGVKEGLIDAKFFYVKTSDKERLMRQLTRENNPDVDEIIRRYKTDREDFFELEDEIPCTILANDTIEDLMFNCETILEACDEWVSQDVGQK